MKKTRLSIITTDIATGEESNKSDPASTALKESENTGMNVHHSNIFNTAGLENYWNVH